MIKTWIIAPQPIVTSPAPNLWDISGKTCLRDDIHTGDESFLNFFGSAEHHIGQDYRFKPPLELCDGDYDNLDESWVENRDGVWVWILVLKRK